MLRRNPRKATKGKGSEESIGIVDMIWLGATREAIFWRSRILELLKTRGAGLSYLYKVLAVAWEYTSHDGSADPPGLRFSRRRWHSCEDDVTPRCLAHN
jgi:hypothetical protein